MKKLEDILGLPEKPKKTLSNIPSDTQIKSDILTVSQRSINELDKVSEALPAVKGLGEQCDAEFDLLAEKATQAYDDLMDLGMNVEARYASKIFDAAANMLKNAIDAKTAKIDTKLRMVDLQLRKHKQTAASKLEDELVDMSNSGVIVSDRNSLLEKIKKINQDQK